jgi:prevent-host-death family protein
MGSTHSIAKAQTNFPKLIREVQAGGVATITRKNQAVAFILGRDRMESIVETMEVMANAEAMRAIGDYEAGKTKFLGLGDIRD